MFKQSIALVFTFFLLAPSLVCAEFAPQFNKSSTDKTNMSNKAPKYGSVYKKEGLTENKIDKSGKIVENNVNKTGQVMESNVNKSGQVMEGQINKSKQVME